MRLLVAGGVAALALTGVGAHAQTTTVPTQPEKPAISAQPEKPAITKDASAALVNMGKSLLAKEYSFKAQTIRVYDLYSSQGHQPLHIFHTITVTVRRPDRLAVHVTGDDGSHDLFYDGKKVSVTDPGKNKYASVAAPNTIDAMMRDVMARLSIDFPLADFLTNAPNKAFLSGVTTGWQVGTATIDGTPTRHLFFKQPPGIELELWVDKTEQALPRRLIVTYRSLPTQPTFVAQFSDWNFAIHPSDALFAFTPPSGATRIQLGQARSGGDSTL